MTPVEAANALARIYQLLGQILLLPIPLGQKAPDFKGWEVLTFADSQHPDYQRRLLACLQKGGNLGILLGPASGRLLAIDADSDETVQSLLGQFPWLANTFRTRGQRGCQFWARLEADCEYPGTKAVYNFDGGELRLGGGGGAQSIFWGRHPAGMDYQILVRNPPIEISLADLDELAVASGTSLNGSTIAAPVAPKIPQRDSRPSPSASSCSLVKRVCRYLDECDPAISGQGGHNTTYRVLCHVVNGFALDREQALSAAHYYNQKCKPSWSEEELEHKIDDALKAPHNKPCGHLLNDQPVCQHQGSMPPFAAALEKDFGAGRSNQRQKQDASLNHSNAPLKQSAASLQIFYDSQRAMFWAPNNRDGWVAIKASDVRRWLQERGYRPRIREQELVSEIDALLTAFQRDYDVDYAGSLAGHRRGVYQAAGGKRILVKDSPMLIEPKPGDWPLLRGIIHNMLGHEQELFLFGWLKVGFESLASSKLRVGQALTLAGPPDCGKSLLQDIFTEIFGGRSAKPHRYMSGATPFNGDLFGSEHLIIEDEQASTDLRARRNFGAKIKEITANVTNSCHAKHRQAIALSPFWRLSISVNDEPENLMILPPLDDSLLDKFIILKAAKHPMPMPSVSDQERERFVNVLRAELPHFLHFLTNWQIPPRLVSQRYGITHFHHPDILDALGTFAPETKLLELIDTEIFGSPVAPTWEGSASQLERELVSEQSNVAREARQLFSFPTSCGTYLGRLAKAYPARFSQTHTRLGNRWTIYRRA